MDRNLAFLGVLLEPILEFKYDTAIFCRKIGRKVIFTINQIQVTHGFKSPLKPTIYIEVFNLGIVLYKGSEKHTFGER
jgi:hypothetical protein